MHICSKCFLFTMFEKGWRIIALLGFFPFLFYNFNWKKNASFLPWLHCHKRETWTCQSTLHLHLPVLHLGFFGTLVSNTQFKMTSRPCWQRSDMPPHCFFLISDLWPYGKLQQLTWLPWGHSVYLQTLVFTFLLPPCSLTDMFSYAFPPKKHVVLSVCLTSSWYCFASARDLSTSPISVFSFFNI